LRASNAPAGLRQGRPSAGEEEGGVTTHPPTFQITDKGGCIGRFWWVNTIPYTGGGWWPELFPFWGTSHWYRP
jgi:hypothetical protein